MLKLLPFRILPEKESRALGRCVGRVRVCSRRCRHPPWHERLICTHPMQAFKLSDVLAKQAALENVQVAQAEEHELKELNKTLDEETRCRAAVGALLLRVCDSCGLEVSACAVPAAAAQSVHCAGPSSARSNVQQQPSRVPQTPGHASRPGRASTWRSPAARHSCQCSAGPQCSPTSSSRTSGT